MQFLIWFFQFVSQNYQWQASLSKKTLAFAFDNPMKLAFLIHKIH